METTPRPPSPPPDNDRSYRAWAHMSRLAESLLDEYTRLFSTEDERAKARQMNEGPVTITIKLGPRVPEKPARKTTIRVTREKVEQ